MGQPLLEGLQAMAQHLQFLKYGMQFFSMKIMTKKVYLILFIIFSTISSLVRLYIFGKELTKLVLIETFIAGVIFIGLVYLLKNK